MCEHERKAAITQIKIPEPIGLEATLASKDRDPCDRGLVCLLQAFKHGQLRVL
jgi:hypothetical protein